MKLELSDYERKSYLLPDKKKYYNIIKDKISRKKEIIKNRQKNCQINKNSIKKRLENSSY